MFNYAQLDDSGVVVTVAILSGEPSSIDVIKVDNYDTTLLGKRYNRETNQFEDEANAD